MNLTLRTKLSLCQFLSLFAPGELVLLLAKHGLPTDEIEYLHPGESLAVALKDSVLHGVEAQLGHVVQEIAYTRDAMRAGVSPRYLFDQRWKDLCLCLELDDYALQPDEYGRETGRFIPIEPDLQGLVPLADDLAHELDRSAVPGTEAILDLLEKSAVAFRLEDFNACLGDSRVALETLAKTIAGVVEHTDKASFDPKKWGQVVEHLRVARFINRNEEKGITGVYSLISPGSHAPLGFTDREFARLGRNFAVSTCYFLAKRLNAQRA